MDNSTNDYQRKLQRVLSFIDVEQSTLLSDACKKSGDDALDIMADVKAMVDAEKAKTNWKLKQPGIKN